MGGLSGGASSCHLEGAPARMGLFRQPFVTVFMADLVVEVTGKPQNWLFCLAGWSEVVVLKGTCL